MAIEKSTVLEAGFPEDAALTEIGFFENLYRRRVAFEKYEHGRTVPEWLR